MKKTILAIILLLLGISLHAQQSKSYVTVYADLASSSSAIHLSGDIPSSMSQTYTYADFGYRSMTNDRIIGSILNMLAENSFTVDNVCCDQHGYTVYLLSKATSSTSTSAKQIIVQSSSDDVTEVARYNLQGIPVTPSDKGVQIIVYSNYTTQTVVVE